jgi:hypothetical protein
MGQLHYGVSDSITIAEVTLPVLRTSVKYAPMWRCPLQSTPRQEGRAVPPAGSVSD